MRTLSIRLAIVAAAVAAAQAQAQAQPPVRWVNLRPLYNVDYSSSTPQFYTPVPVHHYPTWGRAYRASTVFEGYARGQAALNRSQGQYNLLTAEARVVDAEAERREIENREDRIESYHAMRELSREERAAERVPRPTEEQLRRIAAARRPAPLSPSELDARTGRINWPLLLQEEEYEKLRTNLEEVFAQRAATGEVTTDDLGKAEAAADVMLQELKSHVREVPLYEYGSARQFIKSLAYEVRQPVS